MKNDIEKLFNEQFNHFEYEVSDLEISRMNEYWKKKPPYLLYTSIFSIVVLIGYGIYNTNYFNIFKKEAIKVESVPNETFIKEKIYKTRISTDIHKDTRSSLKTSKQINTVSSNSSITKLNPSKNELLKVTNKKVTFNENKNKIKSTEQNHTNSTLNKEIEIINDSLESDIHVKKIIRRTKTIELNHKLK